MSNLTNNEQIALNSIMNICAKDFSAGVTSIAKEMDIKKESVKGIVGSLVKKDMIVCEEENRAGRVIYDIFPVNENGEILSFGEWS